MESATNWLKQEIAGENLLKNSKVWRELHPTLNDIDSLLVTSIHSKKKVWWLGPCGHEWESIIHHRAAKKHTACPFCSNKRILIGFNDAYSRFPAFRSEWDSVINGDPKTCFPKSNQVYAWISTICGHKYNQRLDHKLRGDGCPICSGYTILTGFNDLATKHSHLASKVAESNPELDPSNLPLRGYQKVKLVCDKCKNIFEDTIRKHSDKPGIFCLKCRKVKSRLELLVSCRLDELGINYVQESKPLRRKDENNISKPFELDFLLIEYKLAFEIQDFSTHSRHRDDEIVKRQWGPKRIAYKKGPAYHELKRRLAKEQLDVTLIDIWQDELFNAEWEHYLVDFGVIKHKLVTILPLHQGDLYEHY